MHTCKSYVLPVTLPDMYAVGQDELISYLKKFTDVWVAYALLIVAYLEVFLFQS